MKLYSFLFFAVTLFTANTHAGMITNHQFKTDDATYYATLDTNTGIEWLRGATKGQSYNEVFARLDTDLKGWRFPTQDEFKNLLTTYYRDLNPLGGGRESFTSYGRPTAGAIDANHFSIYMLSSNFQSYSSISPHALYVDNEGVNRYFGNSVSGGYFNTTSFYNTKSFDDNFSNSNYSYLLVSDGGLTEQSIANPELNNANPNSPYNTPGPLSLAGLGFFALGYTRLKRSH